MSELKCSLCGLDAETHAENQCSPPAKPATVTGVYRVEKRGDGDYSYYVLGPSIKAEWCFDAEADAEDVVFALNAAVKSERERCKGIAKTIYPPKSAHITNDAFRMFCEIREQIAAAIQSAPAGDGKEGA